MLTDPVVHWGLLHRGTIDWAHLDDSNGVIAAARAFGLNNGVTYSTGPQNRPTILGLTRSKGPFHPDELAEVSAIVDAIHALTDGFDALSPAEQDGLRGLLRD